jgi:hypothetical protein
VSTQALIERDACPRGKLPPTESTGRIEGWQVAPAFVGIRNRGHGGGDPPKVLIETLRR